MSARQKALSQVITGGHMARMGHAEHPAIYHANGLSRFMSPKKFSVFSQLADGVFKSEVGNTSYYMLTLKVMPIKLFVIFCRF